MRNIKKTMYGNRIECVLFLLTIIIFTAFGAFQFPILRDHGIYSYISQELTRGNPVYSTAPDIKGPFLYMVDAFWMMIFWFMPNWVAIRIGMLIMSGLTMVFFYKTLFRMFGNKTMPLFSTIILMSFAFFAEYFVLGDPKGIALFLLMAGLYSLFSGKHLLSGISFGLMPMTWQPTGIFLLAPLIYFYLDGFDRKKTFYLFAGIALSVSFVGAHFIFTNTLPNMIEFAVLLPLEYKSGVYFKDTLIAIFNIIACYNTEIIFLAIGSLGTIYYVAKGARLLVMKRMEYAKSNKMLFAMILPYIFFSTYILADMQIADDIILQLAPISMVCGHIFYKAFIRLSFKMEKINIMFLKNSNAALIMITLMISAYSFYPALQPVYPENYIVTYAKNIEGKVAPIQIPLMTIEKYGIVDSFVTLFFHRTGEENTVQDQISLANYINENMNSTDSVLSLAAPEILFLSGKKNINKYPLIESDVFMLHLEKTSNMENFREEIISAKPKFIIYNYDYILDTIGIRDFASDNYNRIDDIKYLVYERIDR